MARQGNSKTLSSHVYDLMSHDIMNGRWTPGTRLQPAELSSVYGTSTTVIREVLLRLSAEMLVTSQPAKGFAVPALTLRELEDLTLVRIHNDTFALRLAIERGSLQWEGEVLTKHHVLANTDRRPTNDPLHISDAWSSAHREFHAALVSGCEIALLMDLSRTLFDATELYRRWAAPTPNALQRDVPHEHELIVKAVVEHDADRASELLSDHYTRSFEVMKAAGFVV